MPKWWSGDSKAFIFTRGLELRPASPPTQAAEQDMHPRPGDYDVRQDKDEAASSLAFGSSGDDAPQS